MLLATQVRAKVVLTVRTIINERMKQKFHPLIYLITKEF